MLPWFDADASRYWVMAWSSFALLCGVALIPLIAEIGSDRLEQRCRRLLPPWLFVTALVLCFVAFRWPLWFVGKELNVDESMMISEALTLRHDPMCWRSVDGTTHGPLDTYPLLLARVVGLALDYQGARIVGAGLILILIYSCYRAVAASGRESLARAAVLPIVCFLSFTTFDDFVHYSSEHVPAPLLAVGFCLVASELARPELRKAWSLRWAAAGLVLGAVPMAKLQGAPIAIALLAVAALFDLAPSGISFRNRLRRLVVLVSSASCVTLLFVGIALLSDSWQDAWKSYIVHNLFHAQRQSATYMEMIRKFCSDEGGFAPFAAGCAVMAGTALPLALFGSTVAKRFAVLTMLFLVASLAATLAPGWPYSHYLLFAAAPIGLMAAAIWQAAYQVAEQRWSHQRGVRILLILLLGGAGIFPQIYARVAAPHPYVGQLASYQELSSDPVASEILRYAKPGESLGMWGWMCRYYVLTGMPQATREAHTRMQLEFSPEAGYFRYRYLRDITRNRPPVFVDAVGPNNFTFADRSWATHERFKPLAAFIAENYRQVADINSCRIFVRIDRLH